MLGYDFYYLIFKNEKLTETALTTIWKIFTWLIWGTKPAWGFLYQKANFNAMAFQELYKLDWQCDAKCEHKWRQNMSSETSCTDAIKGLHRNAITIIQL